MKQKPPNQFLSNRENIMTNKNKCLQILDTLYKKAERNLQTRFISDSTISQKTAL